MKSVCAARVSDTSVSIMMMCCSFAIRGIREYIFLKDPVKSLVNLCVRDKINFSQIVCIAHNACAFDAQFLLKELC